MVALASKKKRSIDFSSNFEPHIPKKIKFLASINQTLVPRLSSKSFVVRSLKYPSPINPIRREVHAPCRQMRGGLKEKMLYDVDCKGDLEMGVSIARKYEEVKRNDFDGSRSLKEGIEVIDIDDDDDSSGGGFEEVQTWGCEKSNLVEILDDSGGSFEEMEVRGCEKSNPLEISDDDDSGGSFDEVEARDYEKSDLMDQDMMEVDEDVVILDDYDDKDSSVVTMGLSDGNLKEESVGKMIDSLDMKPTSDSYFYVPLYKKLLGSVEKIAQKLKRIDFHIGLNVKCLEINRFLRPQKKGKQVKGDVVAEAFVPLTREEKAEVSRAFSKSNRKRELISHESSNIDITGEVLQCLRPGEWLNDEVINLYLELLKEREQREPQKFLKCHFFSTFFYKKLINDRGGYEYQSVKRWTSQNKLGYCLLECDKIFVPIHKEIHWCLAVINNKDKKFQYLDSLRGRDSKVLKALARYYVDEVKDKSGKSIDLNSWKQEFVEDLPTQKNGYDCGVFMIKNIDFYSRNIGLCFNQGDMPYFRLRTAKELLRLKAD